MIRDERWDKISNQMLIIYIARVSKKLITEIQSLVAMKENEQKEQLDFLLDTFGSQFIINCVAEELNVENDAILAEYERDRIT